MLIGILDMLLKARAERVKAEKNQIKKKDTVKEKEIESLEAPVEKKGSVLLGLVVVSVPILLLAYWFIGIENIFLNILGYILYSLLGLFILLLVFFGPGSHLGKN